MALNTFEYYHIKYIHKHSMLIFDCILLKQTIAVHRINSYLGLSIVIIRYYYYYWPTSTKPQAWILRKSYNGCSVGRHGVLKRDRIPLLNSYRQALEQKCGVSGVFGDDIDASPNLLYQLDSHGIPCPRRLYGYKTEDVCAGWAGIIIIIIIIINNYSRLRAR